MAHPEVIPMRPLAILKCIARAAVKGVGNLGGLPLGEAAVGLAEAAWGEWKKEKAEAERKAELDAVVKMAGDEFRKQVEAVVKEVAADKPPAVQKLLSVYLEQVPELARKRFARPEDRTGRTIPPGFRLDKSADLASLLAQPSRPPATEDGEPPATNTPRVTLRYTAGPLAGQEVSYTEPAVLLFGRGEDCNPQLPQDGCGRVSRRHCFVEVNPPDVRIRDLGSLKGTFVGGNLIGRRPKGEPPKPGFESSTHALNDGAEVRLTDRAQVAFTVWVEAPEAPEVRACAWCGKEGSKAVANRAGMFVCAACQSNMAALVQGMVCEAKAGNTELKAVKGYELVERIGQGGMGAVYLARHPTTGPAAVKLMLPKVAADERAVRLFQREIRNTMALNHRNVVRCLDHGFTKGVFFFVLEYCDGGSVAGLMGARGGKLPVDEAVEIALQALDGLHSAHTAEIPFVRGKDGRFGPGRGLVHRDIKPANLFLSGWGSGRVVKVGDYGLAKGFDEAGLSGGTRTGDVAGTWEFMCRQQVVGYKAAGPEVDVWALAASLYQMLTGQLPRDFPEGRDPWLVVLEDNPVPILKRNPKLPAKLAEVIDHALTEEPKMPFASAAEFKQALEEVA
jgi:pSer/pThr/pTyr-binding forkhead associated (FHA) protein